MSTMETGKNHQRIEILLRFRIPKDSLEGFSLESKDFNLIIDTNKPGTLTYGFVVFAVTNLGRMRTRGDWNPADEYFAP